DVAGNQQTLAAFFFDKVFCLSSVVMLIEIDDGHVGAFHRKISGDRAADATITSRDDGDLALEFSGSAIIVADGDRRRSHRTLNAWPFRLFLRRTQRPLGLLLCSHERASSCF